MIEKGTWVSIRKIILLPQERTGNLPKDTQAVPYEMWVKGTLGADAELGETVTVQTRTGRTEQGVLEATNPNYALDFGDFMPEILRIGEQARALLKGRDAP